MTAIVFETEGHMDLRALQTFGINAKPNSANPIGYFGTGLKYAIAVLVRNEIPVSIWIGEKEYVFYCKKEEFRDKEFSFVYMKQSIGGIVGALNSSFKWHHTQLPFTTEFGKNWELWQAFRELESNTRDENGTTQVWNDECPTFTLKELVPPKDGVTRIIVSGEKFAEVYKARDDVFLNPAGLVLRGKARSIEVYNSPSKYVYYRGLRVMTLPKPSMYTYNILGYLTLTEDRTAMYDYSVRQYIVDWFMHTDDENAIHAVAIMPDNGPHYESVLTWGEGVETPGEAFNRVVGKIQKRRGVSNMNARVYSRYKAYEVPEVSEDDDTKLYVRLQYWIDSGEIAGHPDLVLLLTLCQKELEDRDL